MTRSFCALILMLFALSQIGSLSAFASTKKEKDGRDSQLNRIKKACEEILEENDHKKPELACACVVREFALHLDDKELDLITRSHEFDPKAEEELQKPEHTKLIWKDYNITNGCMKDPKGFKYDPSKDGPDEDSPTSDLDS